MSSPPPTKPPRGVKQGKETSGLLMSVIRTLSASETNEQREKERAKLEKEYKKSDARLDELVAAHAQEITDVMQKFSSVSSSLSAWGQHCSAAEARLGACRALLRVRRHDLRRLWADARTHHHALRMLTDIERVAVCSWEARGRAGEGRAVGAAHSLRAALLTARTELPALSALGATTEHLETARRDLAAAMVKRLSEAVYGAEGAGRGWRGAGGVGGEGGSTRRRTTLLLAELTKSEEVTDAYLQDITPEFEASLTEEDKTFETNVMISLEALGVLEQLKEATEKFKVQIQNELLEVIDSVSRRIVDDVDIDEGEEDSEIQDPEGVSETGRPLARLVNCLTEEFKACGNRNRRLLQLWRAALQKYNIPEQSLHTEQHYWSAVQQVMQLLLTEYLEIESVTLSRSRPPDAVPELRLADYFGKRKPQRRRDKLFKLTTPLPATSVRARLQRYPLVCAPRPELLHDVLPALHALCALLERPGSGECSLRMFVSDYVRWGESERLAREARRGVERAGRAPGAWRERTAGGGRDTERPVFSCAVAAWRCVERAARAARRCGPCGGAGAARAAAGAAGVLGAAVRAHYARLAPAAPARAARWLADDDIVRFLRALPNYEVAVRRAARSEEELKQAYEREAEILGSSLGDGEVTSREITQRIDALVELALMSESTDWLRRKTRTLPAIICAPSQAGPGLELTKEILDEIESAAAVFEDISQKCLLFLHLEMRIECFHYLGQEEREGGGSESAGAGEDPEGEGGGAAPLARRLLAFHEAAAPVLAPAAMAYIMNGIGEMMSAAVVWRWRSSAGPPEPASARLAALRHCLAALALPHDGLHAAHAYMHLLTCTPEVGLPPRTERTRTRISHQPLVPQEIIASVRSRGPQFSELQYLNAFKALGARRGLGAPAMQELLRQLAAALGHVGVTV